MQSWIFNSTRNGGQCHQIFWNSTNDDWTCAENLLMISFQCTIPSLGLSRDGPSCDTPGSVSCVSSAHTRYSHRILTDQLTVAACSLLPPVRVFNCRALLPSYLCFSYKTTITHAKYQFHFKRAGSTNNRPNNASQLCRQTIAIIMMIIWWILLTLVSSSGFLVLVTLAVTGQRRFGAGHMNQMFDRMQRAQQDSYGKNRFYCDHGSNDSLIGVNSFQNKFSAWPFPRQWCLDQCWGQQKMFDQIFWTGWNDNFIIGSEGLKTVKICLLQPPIQTPPSSSRWWTDQNSIFEVQGWAQCLQM